MREIIYNYDHLTDKDITETVIRTKALIVNGDDIFLGNESNIIQFPGGHLEERETLEECLKREVLEETGIYLDDTEIKEPFYKVTYLNKDYPTVGINRKNEIYYYLIETTKNIDLSKRKLTEQEIEANYQIIKLPLTEAITAIKENIPKNITNETIAPDMIAAITIYLNNKEC